MISKKKTLSCECTSLILTLGLAYVLRELSVRSYFSTETTIVVFRFRCARRAKRIYERRVFSGSGKMPRSNNISNSVIFQIIKYNAFRVIGSRRHRCVFAASCIKRSRYMGAHRKWVYGYLAVGKHLQVLDRRRRSRPHRPRWSLVMSKPRP